MQVLLKVVKTQAPVEFQGKCLEFMEKQLAVRSGEGSIQFMCENFEQHLVAEKSKWTIMKNVVHSIAIGNHVSSS